MITEFAKERDGAKVIRKSFDGGETYDNLIYVRAQGGSPSNELGKRDGGLYLTKVEAFFVACILLEALAQ